MPGAAREWLHTHIPLPLRVVPHLPPSRAMPAFVIAAVSSSQTSEEAAAALAEYRAGNTEVVAAHGGRFVVRGGDVERLEGDWDPLRVVIMEFPDRDAARAWHASPAYAPLKSLRQGVSQTSLVLVDGLPT